MYRQPTELVARKHKRAHGFPNRGKVGRRVGKKLVEYHDRAAIEDGVLKDRGLEIVGSRTRSTLSSSISRARPAFA